MTGLQDDALISDSQPFQEFLDTYGALRIRDRQVEIQVSI
jgi:hypothetical protein